VLKVVKDRLRNVEMRLSMSSMNQSCTSQPGLDVSALFGARWRTLERAIVGTSRERQGRVAVNIGRNFFRDIFGG